jgi:hypothetical protein
MVHGLFFSGVRCTALVPVLSLLHPSFFLEYNEQKGDTKPTTMKTLAIRFISAAAKRMIFGNAFPLCVEMPKLFVRFLATKKSTGQRHGTGGAVASFNNMKKINKLSLKSLYTFIHLRFRFIAQVVHPYT